MADNSHHERVLAALRDMEISLDAIAGNMDLFLKRIPTDQGRADSDRKRFKPGKPFKRNCGCGKMSESHDSKESQSEKNMGRFYRYCTNCQGYLSWVDEEVI